MKLTQLYVSDYKNLNEFTLDFSTQSFLEMLVGKNGSGKSNFIERYFVIYTSMTGEKRDMKCISHIEFVTRLMVKDRL